MRRGLSRFEKLINVRLRYATRQQLATDFAFRSKLSILDSQRVFHDQHELLRLGVENLT